MRDIRIQTINFLVDGLDSLTPSEYSDFIEQLSLFPSVNEIWEVDESAFLVSFSLPPIRSEQTYKELIKAHFKTALGKEF